MNYNSGTGIFLPIGHKLAQIDKKPFINDTMGAI